jgi:cation diffusion facilitator family transporter
VAAHHRGYRAGLRAAAWSVGVGGGLSVLKIGAGLAGGSSAAVADGVESACDMLASAVLYGGLAISLKPADATHPYGHERAESVSAIALATLLMVAGVSLALGAVLTVGRIGDPPALFTVWPLGLSIVVKIVMATWKMRLGRAAGSTSLRGDALNDAADVLSGLIAVTGILLARLDPVRFHAADHAAGAVVASIIVVTGIRLLRRSLSELMDEAPPPDAMRRIRAIAGATPGIVRVDKCLGRRSGTGYYLDIHLEVDPTLPINRAHAIGHAAKAALLAGLPAVRDVLTHIEPAPRPGRARTRAGRPRPGHGAGTPPG